MEVNRKGNQITIVLSDQEEAVGLYAYLSGQAHEVPALTAEKGKWIYDWFFGAVAKLATNFDHERSVATMSGETASLPTLQYASRKSKRR